MRGLHLLWATESAKLADFELAAQLPVLDFPLIFLTLKLSIPSTKD